MLTLKVMSPGGGEEIYCGLSVGFNPHQQSISVSGMDMSICLEDGEVAYVMNPSGKTIARYERGSATQERSETGRAIRDAIKRNL